MKCFYTFFFLISITCFLNGQNKESAVKTIQAQRIELSQIILDGRLEEDFWEENPGSSGFLMQEPVEGGQPTEKTIIKIAYDENNLYIGAIFYDSDPSGIKSFQKRRDASLGTDDRFMWILDTYQDGRNAYFFEINPGGLMGDGVLSVGQGTSFNKDWDGIWRPWTHIGTFGWSCEIRIPFRTLNFDPNSETWGINFQRTIRRKNEELLWTGHKRNQGVFRPQDAGRLTGLKQVSQGLGLEAVPYAKAEQARIRNNDTESYDNATTMEAGMDINYSLTPKLKASVTINTDFAETEVDTRQVNLTRFPLFFPERRDFFLEGANIYSFAPRSGVTPYFSRKIGLDSGNPVPISYGGRILGRVGNFDVAAQQVRTRRQGDLDAEDFSVVRLKSNILKESSIGFVYTRRHTKGSEDLPDPIQDRHTFGADLALNTSTFLKNKNLQFQAFFVFHNSPSPLDDTTSVWDRSSRGIRFNFPNQPWSGSLSYREFGTHFVPAVGFNRRNGFRRAEPRISYSPLIEKSKLIRELTWEVSFEHLMSLDWQKLTQNIRFTPLEIRFESGDEISYQFIRNFEQLERDFNILGDDSIIIPLDDYTNWIHNIELSTARFRKVVYSLEMRTGGFWSGRSTTYENELTVRPVPGINLSGVYQHTRVRLSEGDFNTNLFRFVGNFDFTPFISLSANIQYDDVSKRIGMNNRFRYTITPGSDIFLVYNHNWVDILGRFQTASNVGVMKVTYTHRF